MRFDLISFRVNSERTCGQDEYVGELETALHTGPNIHSSVKKNGLLKINQEAVIKEDCMRQSMARNLSHSDDEDARPDSATTSDMQQSSIQNGGDASNTALHSTDAFARDMGISTTSVVHANNAFLNDDINGTAISNTLSSETISAFLDTADAAEGVEDDTDMEKYMGYDIDVDNDSGDDTDCSDCTIITETSPADQTMDADAATAEGNYGYMEYSVIYNALNRNEGYRSCH